MEDEYSPNFHSVLNTTESSQQNFRRSRNESIKEFTKRFRSFSIDLMRSIEQAHDMVDLKNSKFANATQSVATQQYNAYKTDCGEYDPEYGADFSDDGQNYLRPYYRSTSKKNTIKTRDQTLTEMDALPQLECHSGSNLPSTSSSFTNRIEIENNNCQNDER